MPRFATDSTASGLDVIVRPGVAGQKIVEIADAVDADGDTRPGRSLKCA
jgi:hypothetical protein